MRKLMTLFALIAFVMVSTPTISEAGSKRSLRKGQKIFKKKLRKYCRFSGVRFAKKHTQDEWEEIWDEGRFQSETKKICPRLKLKRIKPYYWKYIYQFTYEYGRGGSHVPKC